MTAESVVLINVFEVPEGEDDAFLQGWERTRDFLSTQDGCLSTRLEADIAATEVLTAPIPEDLPRPFVIEED